MTATRANHTPTGRCRHCNRPTCNLCDKRADECEPCRIRLNAEVDGKGLREESFE